MNYRQLRCGIRGLLHALVGVLISAVAQAQAPDANIAQEYFVQQAAGEALLIRVSGFEAEFESKVSKENGEVLLISGVPGNRIAPVFQYITAPGDDRQLTIKVSSSAQTARSEFDLGLTRLTVWDDRSNAVSQAYHMLSFGLQKSNSLSEATWTVKINSLVDAGKLFERFGMKEMRLWAKFLAAQLIHDHLHDYGYVYNLTREVLADLEFASLEKIELASMQLQAAALVGLNRRGALRPGANDPDPVQSALRSTAALAGSLGYLFTQAQALSISGTEYAAQDSFTEALEQFQQAVEISDQVGETEMATNIREQIVAIHAKQGNAPASTEVLQEIETQLAEQGAGDELALNLLAQGRLFIRNYRYRQALEVLLEALNYQNNSAIRKQIHFELASIFHASGQFEEALAYLELTEVDPEDRGLPRINNVLDTATVLGMMASIHRARGDYTRMYQARAAEGRFKDPDAWYFYHQGLDGAAAGRRSSARVLAFFRRALQMSEEEGLGELADLSKLQLCALQDSGDQPCSHNEVKVSRDRLLTGGVPEYAAQARYLWAQILVRRGQGKEAVTSMARLTDEIHFLRHTLPGVLGGWYHELHERVFEFYLELLVAPSSASAMTDGEISLLALSKIRMIRSYSDFDLGLTDTDLLRARLAQRSRSVRGQTPAGLIGQINQDLVNLREPFKRQFSHLSSTGVREYLQSLGKNEILLTYHLGQTMAHAWIADNKGVKRRSLPDAARLQAETLKGGAGLANLGMGSFDDRMDTLGDQLLTPVADLLTDTVYWVPAGPLLGFPLDALRFQGKYLVEQHNVINLLSFPANPNPSSRLETGSLRDVFIAGHPLKFSGDYAMRLETSPEIRAIADVFVGPGLNIVQGTALLEDELRTTGFTNAKLAHLSMPAIIDLKYHDQSQLELSGTELAPNGTRYWSRDIQAQPLDASLVVLSSTRTVNRPISGFGNRPGLVADFVAAGARCVVAAVWSGSGNADTAFLVNFYEDLVLSGNVASSLRKAKLNYLEQNQHTGLFGWVAYQVYIN